MRGNITSKTLERRGKLGASVKGEWNNLAGEEDAHRQN